MAAQFTVTRKMRFADCDPAGIAFYPRLVEHLNGVVEDWFAGPLDYSFHVMHSVMQKGIPTVALNVEFFAPARLGDLVDWSLTVKSLNRSSLALSIRARNPDGRELMHAQKTIVHTDFAQDPPKSEPFPDDLRRKIIEYQDPQ